MKRTRKLTAQQLAAQQAETTKCEAMYPAAKAAAQARADETGYDIGLEWLGNYSGWVARMLPQRQNRFGHELRCEVVMCSDIDKCKPGHGPVR